MNVLKLAAALLLLVSCKPQHKKLLNQGAPQWQDKFPSVWLSEVGTPEKINLLNATDTKPKAKILNRRSKLKFPLDPSRIKYVVKNGKTFLTFPIEKQEQIYGLGLNFKNLNQRGKVKKLHMDHYGSSDNGRTHAPVPFFISTKGYGLLINTARYVDVWVTSAVRMDSQQPPVSRDRTTDRKWQAQPYSDNIEILIPAAGVELVLFSGENMMDIVSRYNLYCEGGFIPPKWGLGFWHRTPTAFSDKEVAKEVAGFIRNDFPLDVIGLEPGWHSYAYPCSFEWDKKRFPQPQKFIKQMLAKNIRLNLWMNPYLSEKGKIYGAMKKYAGTHTVWCGMVPDYTLPAAKKLFSEHINAYQLKYGVSGYKIDEVDGFDVWLWPDVALFPSGLDGEQMRSIYANLVMKIISEAYKKKNERTYGMVRGANAGSSSMPFVIYNDNYSHQDFITAISSASFIGVHWTPEVRASKSSEEWLRRMQTTCFAPIALINAWADGTKPWSFPEVYKACQKVAKLRMRLLPYIYSAFAEYYFEGKPAFRAMNLVEGFSPKVKRAKGTLDGTTNPYEMATYHEVKDQYMMGDALLVAPVFAGETQREVVLPKGKWYDFYTGKLVGDSEVISIKAQKDKIPLFVRDGGIIPMIPETNNTSEWSKGQPLEVRIYGSKFNTFKLYDDDGHSFDYERGKYTIKELSTKKTVKDIVTKGTWTYKNIKWVRM